MLSERQKKLSRLQLEHFHTARGSDGLYVSYVSRMGVSVEGVAGTEWNVEAGVWVRNMMLDVGVCLVTVGKEREKALCDCVGRQYGWQQ